MFGGGKEWTAEKQTDFPSPPPFLTNAFKFGILNHVALCPHKAFLSFTGLFLTSQLPVGTTGKLLSCTLEVTEWPISKYIKQRGTMNNGVAATCFLFTQV